MYPRRAGSVAIRKYSFDERAFSSDKIHSGDLAVDPCTYVRDGVLGSQKGKRHHV